MFKRLFVFFSILFLSISNLFAESYGFTSNHNGFWSWVLGIFLCAVSIAIVLGIWVITSDEFLDTISGNKQWLFLFPGLFTIASFWIYPTYFCSLLGIVLGSIVSLYFVKHSNIFSVICGLISTINFIALTVLAAKNLPQNWWTWKYFCIALIFLLLAQSISYTYYSSKSFAIKMLILVTLTVIITIVNESLNFYFLEKINLIITILLFIIIFISGLKNIKKYKKNRRERLQSIFGKTQTEIYTIIDNVSKIDHYELKKMSNYLKKCLIAFEVNDEVKAIDNLEEFYRYYRIIKESSIKGPTNKKNYKELCDIAKILAEKLEYTYSRPEHEKTSIYKKIEEIINEIDDEYDDEETNDDEIDDTENDDYESNDNDSDYDENDDEAYSNIDNKNKRKQVYKKAIKDLNNMIGMDSVKQQIQELTDSIEMNKERRRLGINVDNPAIHIVFTGNPGTGKTSVARILAELFYGIGLLPKNIFKEVDRSDLVGNFIGDTAIRVKEVCDEVMGGVLFIDEAYSLVKEDNPRDFEQEAIDTLLKRMEDDRGKFVVIVAGYREEMQRFINSNPGLKSRFNRYIDIPDYSADELFQIAEMFAKSENFIFSEEAKKNLKIKIEKIVSNKEKNFANGRTIREEIYNLAKGKMDTRLKKMEKSKRTKEVMMTILPEDLE